PGASLGFTDAQSRAIVYRLSGSQVVEDVTASGVTNTYPITDPRITVQTLNFFVRGVGTSDSLQPQATFILRGTMPIGSDANASTPFAIEGSATERLPELP